MIFDLLFVIVTISITIENNIYILYYMECNHIKRKQNLHVLRTCTIKNKKKNTSSNKTSTYIL